MIASQRHYKNVQVSEIWEVAEFCSGFQSEQFNARRVTIFLKDV
jgi:hypothetical protein